MKKKQSLLKYVLPLFIIFSFGIIPAIICQFFVKAPVSRFIHIRSFRYGKDPSVIRCNRGDTLHLTFSSDDTGHSFYLCLLYTSPSPRDGLLSRMPSSA